MNRASCSPLAAQAGKRSVVVCQSCVAIVIFCDLRCTCNLLCENGCAFTRNRYEERVRSMQHVPTLVTDFLLFFHFSTYHDFSLCIVNIFRLEIGARFCLISRTTIFCLLTLQLICISTTRLGFTVNCIKWVLLKFSIDELIWNHLLIFSITTLI